MAPKKRIITPPDKDQSGKKQASSKSEGKQPVTRKESEQQETRRWKDYRGKWVRWEGSEEAAFEDEDEEKKFKEQGNESLKPLMKYIENFRTGHFVGSSECSLAGLCCVSRIPPSSITRTITCEMCLETRTDIIRSLLCGRSFHWDSKEYDKRIRVKPKYEEDNAQFVAEKQWKFSCRNERSGFRLAPLPSWYSNLGFLLEDSKRCDGVDAYEEMCDRCQTEFDALRKGKMPGSGSKKREHPSVRGDAPTTAGGGHSGQGISLRSSSQYSSSDQCLGQQQTVMAGGETTSGRPDRKGTFPPDFDKNVHDAESSQALKELLADFDKRREQPDLQGSGYCRFGGICCIARLPYSMRSHPGVCGRCRSTRKDIMDALFKHREEGVKEESSQEKRSTANARAGPFGRRYLDLRKPEIWDELLAGSSEGYPCENERSGYSMVSLTLLTKRFKDGRYWHQERCGRVTEEGDLCDRCYDVRKLRNNQGGGIQHQLTSGGMGSGLQFPQSSGHAPPLPSGESYRQESGLRISRQSPLRDQGLGRPTSLASSGSWGSGFEAGYGDVGFGSSCQYPSGRRDYGQPPPNVARPSQSSHTTSPYLVSGSPRQAVTGPPSQPVESPPQQSGRSLPHQAVGSSIQQSESRRKSQAQSRGGSQSQLHHTMDVASGSQGHRLLPGTALYEDPTEMTHASSPPHPSSRRSSRQSSSSGVQSRPVRHPSGESLGQGIGSPRQYPRDTHQNLASPGQPSNVGNPPYPAAGSPRPSAAGSPLHLDDLSHTYPVIDSPPRVDFENRRPSHVGSPRPSNLRSPRPSAAGTPRQTPVRSPNHPGSTGDPGILEGVEDDFMDWSGEAHR